MGHYVFGVSSLVFQVNTRVQQLDLQLNQRPGATLLPAETLYALIVALTKSGAFYYYHFWLSRAKAVE